MKEQMGMPYGRICKVLQLPLASFNRWQFRIRGDMTLFHPPGPKKVEPFDPFPCPPSLSDRFPEGGGAGTGRMRYGGGVAEEKRRHGGEELRQGKNEEQKVRDKDKQWGSISETRETSSQDGCREEHGLVRSEKPEASPKPNRRRQGFGRQKAPLNHALAAQ